MKITDIEKLLKLEAGTLKAAAEKDLDITLSTLHVRTDEEEATLQANIEAQKKERYEAGIEVAEKRKVKDISEKLGYSLEGKAKTLENLLEIHSESLEKKAKKPLTEIETDFKKLQENYIQLEKSHNDFKTSVENEKSINFFRTSLAKAIPANVELLFNPERIISFAEKEISHKVENGTLLLKKGDDILKNPKTLQPLSAEEFMADYIKDFVKKPTGGTGQKDATPNNVGSYEAFIKNMGKEGINPAGEKGQKMLEQAMKQGLIKM